MFWSLCLACVACFYFRDAFTDDSQERSSSASCQWASKRHILCQSGWSDNTGSRELEGVSHYFGYMVFQQLYWMIMLLSHDIRNHIGHQECFLVGTHAPERVWLKNLRYFDDRWARFTTAKLRPGCQNLGTAPVSNEHKSEATLDSAYLKALFRLLPLSCLFKDVLATSFATEPKWLRVRTVVGSR